MTSLKGAFGTNAQQEREGKWFEITGIVNSDGTTPGFLMARMGATNPTYQAAIEKHAKNFKQAMDLDTLTDAVAGPVMKQVFVDTILLNWRHVQPEDDGNEMAYNANNALQLIEDMPNLYFTLVDEAKKIANFRNKDVVEAAGKSLPPSGQHLGNENT